MARAENLQTLTGTAGSAVSIYRFIALAADGKYDHVGTADTGRPDSVSCEAAAADGDTFAHAPVSQPAIAKVEAGAAISVGDLVASDASGKAKTAAAAAAGNHVAGVALTAASADGEIIEVLLRPFQNAAS